MSFNSSNFSAKIAIVAPYQELASASCTICEEMGLDLPIVVGNLEEGVARSRELVEDGVEVIISRGNTATLIAQQVEVPIVRIMVSGFDLVQALAKAKQFSPKIGVFRNVIYGTADQPVLGFGSPELKSLEPVLGIEIIELEIHAGQPVSEVIASAKANGISVIVGDAIAVRYAADVGLHAVLVTSGRESVSTALRQAVEQAKVRRMERARAEQFRVILDSLYEGIIATDAEGYVTLANTAAENSLGVAGKSLVGREIDEVLPSLNIKRTLQSQVSRLGELHRLGNHLVVQNIVPVLTDGEAIGVVATMQNLNHLQAVETKVRRQLYLKGHVAEFTFADISTGSTVMLHLIEEAQEFALSEASILITGETGSGKEMLAQSIHNASLRKNGPFVAINCAAVPENLLESELFGYEEGAFTGAKKGGKKGYFELAHQGTLFLDEIGELPLNLQAGLLRVLQQKAVMRLGGDKMVPVDVRVVAATHRNLEQAVKDGAFRMDLYYRLNVLRLAIPPLRERLEDIPLILKVLVDKICYRTGRVPPVLNEEILAELKRYAWPGNIREFENVLERLVILKAGQRVRSEDLHSILKTEAPIAQHQDKEPVVPFEGTLDDIERSVILHVLKQTGSKEETCKRLGISKSTLWRRLSSWGFQNEIPGSN